MSKFGMSAGGPGREEKASDLRKRFQWLQSFSDDELRDISFCQDHRDLQGGAAKLRENEQYFDLAHPEKGVIEGRAGESIPEDACYIGKSQVKPETWQKLIKPFTK